MSRLLVPCVDRAGDEAPNVALHAAAIGDAVAGGHFRRPPERPFTVQERDTVTILLGGLTWKHERLIKAVFEGCGYRCDVLPTPDVGAYQIGRTFGNPGQCNPA